MVTPPSVSSPLRTLGLCAVAAGLIVLSVAGCVRLLEPQKSDATYYLLDAPTPPDVSPTDTTGLRVGLRRPRLASYLDATRLVTRRGSNRIQFSEFHRWGEELDQGIGRIAALTLETQPDIQSVELVPWPKGATFDYIVQLHVLRFEGVGPPPDPEADEDAPPPEGHLRTVVEWKLLDAADDSVLARGLTQHREDNWQVGDYEALASRLGDALSVLADDIGERLRALR